MEIQKRITHCPDCGTKYRVPAETQHKIAPCAKCGKKFKIIFDEEESPQPQSPPSAVGAPPVSPGDAASAPPPPPEDDAAARRPSPADTGKNDLQTLGFTLKISEDRLLAWVQSPEEIPPSLNLETLKAYLADQGVIYGLVGDGDLEGFIQEEAFHGKEWTVARGGPAQPGRDAEIQYHFDIDTAKVGTVRQGDLIDFRDKGDIPQVVEGALLAEKILLVKGLPGKTVLGEVVPPEEVRDKLMLPGENVRASEDGLKLYAKTGGRPALLRDGRVAVYPELRIDGDVGLETGHIQFSGHVNVRGIIQEGFRVKAGQLNAKEIDKGEVEIEGDIDITGGIIGSKVKSRGNVRVRYIENSRLEALGDVVVRDEILHSHLEINGSLHVTSASGKILASDISARKGLEAPSIGSPASRPCTLVIGVDSQASHRLEEIEREIAAQQKEREDLKRRIEKWKQETNNYSGQIANLAQAQDRGLLEQRSLRALMEELEQKNDLDRLTKARWEYEGLEKKIRGAEESLTHLMEEQDRNTEQILQAQKAIAEGEQKINDLLQEQEQIKKESETEKILPVLKVSQTISGGTVIRGRQSALTVPQDSRRVTFKETLVTVADESGKPVSGWQMVMTAL